MRLLDWRGRGAPLATFLAIALLLLGGLGWATVTVLRLERTQLENRAEAERNGKLRLALWRLDSLVSPAIAKENGRPYDHYSVLFAPALALQRNGSSWPPGSVVEPSPLLYEELPAWIRLHFQVSDSGWSSPQVLSAALAARLAGDGYPSTVRELEPDRARLLVRLSHQFPPKEFRTMVRDQSLPPTPSGTTLLPGARGAEFTNNAALPVQPTQTLDMEYQTRAGQRAQLNQQAQGKNPPKADPSVALSNVIGNGESWINKGQTPLPASKPVAVLLGPLMPLWLLPDEEGLLLVRFVEVGSTQVCQGVWVDWKLATQQLADEVRDLFPSARILPVKVADPPNPERTMTALPLELDPAEEPVVAAAGWSPPRVGLLLAWLAALIALSATALGGWSLLDLSERRFRFVSAVTHELRTPLTTLRLYLDMLASGMVRDEAKRQEYLDTLNAEADRLNRLIGNVLDYSRLERQRPQVSLSRTTASVLLDEVAVHWSGRVRDAGMELVIQNRTDGAPLDTDPTLVGQILGNLVENACKYARSAEDARVWLRAVPAGVGRIAFEIEDRGPGVAAPDRRSIFEPFRRGRRAEEIAGGVGLGLALAKRWAELLGGSLQLVQSTDGPGALFRLVIPG